MLVLLEYIVDRIDTIWMFVTLLAIISASIGAATVLSYLEGICREKNDKILIIVCLIIFVPNILMAVFLPNSTQLRKYIEMIKEN